MTSHQEREISASDDAIITVAFEKPGPRQCCGEFGVITECDGRTDQRYCGVCERVWETPCAVGDFVPAVEA